MVTVGTRVHGSVRSLLENFTDGYYLNCQTKTSNGLFTSTGISCLVNPTGTVNLLRQLISPSWVFATSIVVVK